MDHKPYTTIQGELEGLTRREQYKLLLETVEWARFRKKVLERDSNKCVICHREAESYFEVETPVEEYEKLCREQYEQVASHFCITEEDHIRAKKNPPTVFLTRIIESVYSLEVHHKLYFYDKLPWEYEMQYLISLCGKCHKDVHENNVIYTYLDNKMTSRKEMRRCFKCHGTGYLPQYDHYLRGICFDCGGQGLILDHVSEWQKVDLRHK